jgi:hypothetical protein
MAGRSWGKEKIEIRAHNGLRVRKLRSSKTSSNLKALILGADGEWETIISE